MIDIDADRTAGAFKSAALETEKPRRIVDEDAVARGTIGKIAFEERDPLARMLGAVIRIGSLVRSDETMDMRPVGTPQRTCRRGLVEQAAERDRVVPRLALLRAKVAIREADPPVVLFEQFEDQAHSRLRCPAPIIEPAHMVDDGRDLDSAQLIGNREEVVAEAEDLCRPAQRADAIEQAAEAPAARSELEIAAEFARAGHDEQRRSQSGDC